MRTMRRGIALTLAGLLAGVTTAGAWRQSGGARVSKREAHDLALSTLLPRARSSPGIQFDTVLTEPPRGFYTFEIVADTPPGTSFNLGFFAVNERTGDVWDWSACIHLSSPEIVRVQRRLRRESGVSARAFRTLSNVAPCQP